MRKIKAIVLGMIAALLAVVTPVVVANAANTTNAQGGDGAAQSVTADADPAATDCRRLSAANGAGQDILLTTATPHTYSGTAWQNVQCTATTFRLKAGERALVVSNVSAETDCNGTTPTNGQWCEARVLLNGVEGSPIAAEPHSFAFDSVAGGSQNWQAHAFNRGWEVRCGVSTGCQYKYVVQTKMHNSTVTGMWLDEVAAHIRVTIGAPAPL